MRSSILAGATFCSVCESAIKCKRSACVVFVWKSEVERKIPLFDVALFDRMVRFLSDVVSGQLLSVEMKDQPILREAIAVVLFPMPDPDGSVDLLLPSPANSGSERFSIERRMAGAEKRKSFSC